MAEATRVRGHEASAPTAARQISPRPYGSVVRLRSYVVRFELPPTAAASATRTKKKRITRA